MTSKIDKDDVEDCDGLVRCEECGRVLTALPSHLRGAHDMSVSEYREKHDVDRVNVAVNGGATEEDLVNELKKLADELERPPHTMDMMEHGAYSTRPYYDHWDTWGEALNAAGLDLD
jgi:hypothetical protein